MTRAVSSDSRSAWRCLEALVALVLAGACSSAPVRIGPRPPANPTLLSAAEGSGCGFLLLNLMPLGVNGRLHAAYREAQVALGERDVVDSRVTERWYTIPLVGTMLCTEVEATAVQ
jgi:hypothetical protein